MPYEDLVPGIRIAASISRMGGPMACSRFADGRVDDSNSSMHLLKFDHSINNPGEIPADDWGALMKMPAQILIAGYAENFPFMFAITGFPERKYDQRYFDQIIARVSETIHDAVMQRSLQTDSINMMRHLSQRLAEQNKIENPETPYNVSFAMMHGRGDEFYCTGFAFQETIFETKNAEGFTNGMTIHEGEQEAPWFFNKPVASTDALCGRTDGIEGDIKNPPKWLIRALGQSLDKCEHIVAVRQYNRREYSLGGIHNPTDRQLGVNPRDSSCCVLQ